MRTITVHHLRWHVASICKFLKHGVITPMVVRNEAWMGMVMPDAWHVVCLCQPELL